jgi:hypothetical protein
MPKVRSVKIATPLYPWDDTTCTELDRGRVPRRGRFCRRRTAIPHPMPEHPPELPGHPLELPEHILCRSASGTAVHPPELPQHPPELPCHILCRSASGTAASPSGTAISHHMPLSLLNCRDTLRNCRSALRNCRNTLRNCRSALRNCRGAKVFF